MSRCGSKHDTLLAAHPPPTASRDGDRRVDTLGLASDAHLARRGMLACRRRSTGWGIRRDLLVVRWVDAELLPRGGGEFILTRSPLSSSEIRRSDRRHAHPLPQRDGSNARPSMYRRARSHSESRRPQTGRPPRGCRGGDDDRGAIAVRWRGEVRPANRAELKDQVDLCVDADPTGQSTTETACKAGCDDCTSGMADWDVSLVTDMSGMFHDLNLGGTGELTNFNSDIGGWDVSSVTIMGDMFAGAASSIIRSIIRFQFVKSSGVNRSDNSKFFRPTDRSHI